MSPLMILAGSARPVESFDDFVASLGGAAIVGLLLLLCALPLITGGKK